MNKFIKILKRIITNYELKHPLYEEPIYMCPDSKIRNRYKNDNYKIPEDQPQCPIYKDNRCCGGCKFAATCEHCVNCGCFGFTYAQMGANDKNFYLHKASQYYGLGRIGKNKKFDWKKYYFNLKKQELMPNKYIWIDDILYKVISSPNSKGKFTVLNMSNEYYSKMNIYDLPNYIYVYENEKLARKIL